MGLDDHLDDDDFLEDPPGYSIYNPTVEGVDETPTGVGEEFMSPQRESAMYYHVLYLDFIAAGFDRDQALTLTSAAITKQMEINAMLANLRRMRGDG